MPEKICTKTHYPTKVAKKTRMKQKLCVNLSKTLISFLPIFLQLMQLKICMQMKAQRMQVNSLFFACAPQYSLHSLAYLASFFTVAISPSQYSLGLATAIFQQYSKSSKLPMYPPNMNKTTTTANCQRATPMIYRHIAAFNTVLFEVGGCKSTFSRGGSVDRAKAANVSIIILIQRSYTALNGVSAKKRMPKTIMRRHEMLTVIQNCKNLETL